MIKKAKYPPHHYPFGSIVESRSWKGDYRYGFNGKETDSETFEGVVAYEARIYDSRIGRFFSTDPREAEYAWQSTYVYFMNSPIAVLDYNGMGSDDDPPENGSERTVDGCTEYYNDNEGWTSDATTLREAVATAARPRAKESKPLSNRAISFLDKASDYIPFVGGLKQIGRSYNADDGKGAGIGAGEVALDALLLATTGGIGNLIKSGIKAVVKTVAKESVQNYIGGQVSEGLDDAGIPIGVQVVVGVTLGIHKKPNAGKELSKFSKIPPGDLIKLKGNQGWKDGQGYIYKKDMKHKDHWDVTDPKTGKKVKEIDFNGNQIWPDGPKNKNKR